MACCSAKFNFLPLQTQIVLYFFFRINSKYVMTYSLFSLFSCYFIYHNFIKYLRYLFSKILSLLLPVWGVTFHIRTRNQHFTKCHPWRHKGTQGLFSFQAELLLTECALRPILAHGPTKGPSLLQCTNIIQCNWHSVLNLPRQLE